MKQKIVERMFEGLPEQIRKYFTNMGLAPSVLFLEDCREERHSWQDYEQYKKQIDRLCEGDSTIYERSIKYLTKVLKL